MEDAAVEYRTVVISFLAVGVLLAGCFVWSLVQFVRSKSPPRLGGSCERRLRCRAVYIGIVWVTHAYAFVILTWAELLSPFWNSLYLSIAAIAATVRILLCVPKTASGGDNRRRPRSSGLRS